MNPQCAIFIGLALVSFFMAQVTYKPAPKPPAPPLVYHIAYIVESIDNRIITYGNTTVWWGGEVNDAKQMSNQVIDLIRKDKPEYDGRGIVILNMNKLDTKP